MLPLIFSLAVLVAAALLGHAVANPRSQWLGRTLVHGSRAGRKIALTFDDGPGPETPAVLDLLREAGVRATFFLCGKHVERFPELARRVAAEGHEIGNHTYSHPWLIGRTPGRIAYEIARAEQVICDNTGGEPRLFRPPYGVRWFGLFPYLAGRRIAVVMWSLSGNDWKLPAHRIAERVVGRTQPGDVVLLHDAVPPGEKGDRKATVAALREMLPSLTRKYELVTVSELFAEGQAEQATV